MNIRALIVDDEPRARKGIRVRLQEYPNIKVVGECSSGTEAVQSINTLLPDLVFLDIQMPEMNGFEVLQKIETDSMPLIVFVTAYDDYAVKAFEFHAFDYLLKPVGEDRFQETLNHVLSEIQRRNLQSYSLKIKAMMNDYLAMIGLGSEEQPLSSKSTAKSYLTRFMIKTADQITVLSADEVDWIESAGDLVYIHTKIKKYIYRETLVNLEHELDPQKFSRIHRSAIINLEKVRLLHPVSHGDFDVVLHNGVKLRLSRTYRDQFKKNLRKP